MTEEKVPRRLKRFYRPQNEKNYNSNFNDLNYSKNDDYSRIPSMDYEDIDEKNLKEIEKIEQKNLEEKLATLEIEKFKKENKRMPNKNEQEQLANSLYEQFKNNPIKISQDYDEESEIITPRERYKNRYKRNRENNESQEIKNELPQENIGEIEQKGDIKSLFEDVSDDQGKKQKNDFDLGLNFEDDIGLGDDLEELEDFSLNKKKKKK